MMPNVINELVEYGKSDIKKFVGRYLFSPSIEGRPERQKTAINVSSLLILALKKSPPDIDVKDIRSLIVEENFDLLSNMADHDTNLIQMFAIATGRVVQITEYLNAIERIAQTCENDRSMTAALNGLAMALDMMRRYSVRMYLDEVKMQPTLCDINYVLREISQDRV